jgi:hypothetical protein
VQVIVYDLGVSLSYIGRYLYSSFSFHERKNT